MKKLLSVALALSVLVACSAEEPEQDVESDTVEETTAESANTGTTESVMFGEAPERDDDYFEESSTEEGGVTALEENTLNILRDAYEGTGHVYYNEVSKSYIIISSEPRSEILYEYVRAGNHSESWDVLVGEFISLSETIYVSMGEGYSVKYMTPMSGEEVILTVKDGVVEYDFSDE